ncbi:restriction endonuclease [Catenuloplanes japonicus]|uniref:restriction endonuclease n=1 Tax=Catenuloplanes japonicus TaxID=33876 RepID=UPI0005263398|nr:restriction endonuclease [Catenuloplanes japonicus]
MYPADPDQPPDPDEDTLRRLTLFDASISCLLGGFEPPVEVGYNRRVEGRLSRSLRRVDVLIQGAVLGIQVTAAIECLQRRRRPVDVGAVDRFVGKLLDIGADRGILYSCTGFTDRARARAAHAQSPPVLAITLSDGRLARDTLPPHDSADVGQADFALFLRIGGTADLWSP